MGLDVQIRLELDLLNQRGFGKSSAGFVDSYVPTLITPLKQFTTGIGPFESMTLMQELICQIFTDSIGQTLVQFTKLRQDLSHGL